MEFQKQQDTFGWIRTDSSGNRVILYPTETLDNLLKKLQFSFDKVSFLVEIKLLENEKFNIYPQIGQLLSKK
jgi:hypothetical protein